MNRQTRRKEFKGYDKLHVPASYEDLEPGFEQELMVQICRAATPGRGDGMEDDQIVNLVFDAINRGNIDVWFRWSEGGAEIKTEILVPGYQSVPVSTHIGFEEVQ